MTRQKWIYFWIVLVAIEGLSLAHLYKSEGAKSVSHSVIILVTVYFWGNLLDRLARSYPISVKHGWNVIGPSPNALILVGMPALIALVAILQQWVDNCFGFDTSHFSYYDLLMIYIDQPLLFIIVISFVLFGILKIFVNRFRWNDLEIEYRNLFFQTQTVRWNEIDRIVLGGAFFANEAVLKSGESVAFPRLTGVSGADQLKAEMRVRGIEIA